MDTRVRRYDDAEKLQLIAEYIHSGESMESFQVKYGMGHCTLSRWIAKFGMSNTSEEQFVEMKEKKIWCQTVGKLRMLLSRESVDAICALFGKSRQAY